MKISIIIPFYNVEKYIERCIKSILTQNETKDYEIILVDDGSEDNSYNNIKSYIDDNFVKYVAEVNSGLGQARNYGLKFARGDYIWFVDSDDTLPPKAIDLAISLIESNVEMIIFNYTPINEIDEELGIGCCVLKDEKKYFLTDDEKKEMLIYPPMSWNRIVKRSIYFDNNIFFPDRKVRYEDLPTTNKLLYYAKNVIITNLQLYNYRIRDNSIMHDRNIQGNLDLIYEFDSIISFYSEQKIMKEYEPYIKVMLLKHIVLDGISRVNHIDKNSEIQHILINYVCKHIKIDAKCGKVYKMSAIEKIRIFLTGNERYKLLYVFNRAVNNIKRILKKGKEFVSS